MKWKLWIGIIIAFVIGNWLWIEFTSKKVTFTIGGSTSILPVVEELARVYMKEHLRVKIFVVGGDSTAGLNGTMTGILHIGAISRELTTGEKEFGLQSLLFGYDGIAIIVNKNNPVFDLSWEQLRRIFAGDYTNWKQVGGRNEKIVVVNRELGSGTRISFEEMVFGKHFGFKETLQFPSTGALYHAVQLTPEAIGYVSLGYLDEKVVKALSIDGVACNPENVLTQTYRLQRPFLLITKDNPARAVEEFLGWINSAAGQRIITKHYVALNNR